MFANIYVYVFVVRLWKFNFFKLFFYFVQIPKYKTSVNSPNSSTIYKHIMETTALFGTVVENRATLKRISGSEAASAILARAVHFFAFRVAGGERTRVHRGVFGGIFSLFSLIRDASRFQTVPINKCYFRPH